MLYPHDFVDYVIIVPNDRNEQSTVSNELLSSPLFKVWASSIILFTVMRIMIRKLYPERDIQHTSQNALIYIFFNTFGLSFGTTSAHGASNLTEKIVVLFVSIFCILSGIFCTGFLLVKMTSSKNVPKINSIAELMEHPELTVIIPETALIDVDILFADYP